MLLHADVNWMNVEMTIAVALVASAEGYEIGGHWMRLLASSALPEYGMEACNYQALFESMCLLLVFSKSLSCNGVARSIAFPNSLYGVCAGWVRRGSGHRGATNPNHLKQGSALHRKAASLGDLSKKAVTGCWMSIQKLKARLAVRALPDEGKGFITSWLVYCRAQAVFSCSPREISFEVAGYLQWLIGMSGSLWEYRGI